MRVLICPDKFRGTATATQAAHALTAGAADAGWDAVMLPLADGGDGTLDAFGGANRRSTVTGPLGEPVDAAWRLSGTDAVIEMALASGLTLAGGAARNSATAATSRGTGELIAAALDAGATRVIVGLGGSASTDGGSGAVEVLRRHAPLDGSRGYRVTAACDVTTLFLDAARVFAPQKGATADEVTVLARRLEVLADEYASAGVDVRVLPGSGAAGGLGGGLAALGAALVPGFALVAEAVRLRAVMATVDHVITGEGLLDKQSYDGKVVGGVLAMAAELGKPCTVIAGDVAGDAGGVRATSLVREFGTDAALHDTLATLRRAARRALTDAARLQSGDGNADGRA